MPKKKMIDGASLIKMVEDGVPRPEIMKKYYIPICSEIKERRL